MTLAVSIKVGEGLVMAADIARISTGVAEIENSGPEN
jgi:hypothetical protein